MVRSLRRLVGHKRTDTMHGDGVVRGIVLATCLTVALEVGFLGLNGVDVNPLHIGTAQAQAAQAPAAAGDFPPDQSIDCDNDTDGGTDFGESAECLANSATSWISANQDLIFYSLAGLAVGVAIIGFSVALAPEIFVSAGLVLALGDTSQVAVWGALWGYTGLMSAATAALFGSICTPRCVAPRSRVRLASPTSDIALPVAIAARVPGVHRIVKACRHGRSRAVCRRVLLAARAYGLSLRQTASVSGALAVTVRRLGNAGTDPGRQTGTAKV